MNRLENKVAIVTGGARGLGGAAASALAAEGARVVIADVLADVAQERVETIKADGGEAVFVQLDVREPDAWAKVVETAVENYGGINILLNNAGITLPRTIEEASLEEFKRVIDINLYGPFLGIQAVLPHMKAAGGGSIINVSTLR